jgi:hypothetical protein
VDAVIGYFTALGLSTAAGLNPYVPVLILGVLSRSTDLIDLSAPWNALEEPVVLAAIAVVAVLDFVGDKIAVIDHVLHAVGMVIAPLAGGVLALGTARAVDIDPTSALVIGVVAALATHMGRSLARPVATVTTAGAANPLVSLGEDATSGVLSFAAVVAPVVAFVLVIAVAIALFSLWRAWRRLGTRLQGRG